MMDSPSPVQGQGVAPSPTPTPTPTGICDRTQEVQDAILGQMEEVSDCMAVTDQHLAGITGTLEISDMSATALKVGDFAGLTGLTGLVVTRSQFTTVPEGIFSGLTSLEKLGLSRGKLDTLPANVFSGLSSLEKLYLHRNELTSLPGTLFSGLTELRSVSLGHNKVTTLHKDQFKGLTNLKEVYVNNNELASLHKDQFKGLTNLELLFLDRNKLTTVSAGVFDDLESLRILILARSDISTLPGDVFDDLGKLQSLDIGDNEMKALPDGMFVGLTSLLSVMLWKNPGTPFDLTADLMRTESGLVVKVAEGAPADVTVSLSAEGGELSADSVDISIGTLKSDPVTVTPDGDGDVTVSVASTGSLSEYMRGLEIVPGCSLVFPAELEVQGTDNSPATGAPVVCGAAEEGQTLTVDTTGIADANGLTGVSYSYQWISSDGTTDTDISGETASTYKVQTSDEGTFIKVRVTFTDDANNQESLTSAATAKVVPRPNSPARGGPTISGAAQVGQTLTADTSGITDGNGLTDVSYSYKWFSNDGTTYTVIQGETTSTYEVQPTDEGKFFKVRVTFTDDDDYEESLDSAPTAVAVMGGI